MLENNKVRMIGKLEKIKETFTTFEEEFCKTELEVYRNSGTYDKVPLIISKKLLDKDYEEKIVEITGSVRTKNKDGHLLISVFVDTIEEKKEYDQNSIECIGYVCKEPIYRVTPNGREITDLFVAVNRKFGNSDYLPCIVWGRNARYSKNFNIGDKVKFKGRFQSRIYKKNDEEKTAYEISIQNINKLEEDNED